MAQPKMAKYDVSSDWFIPELGRKIYPHENPHELPVEVAERLMRNDPYLLRPARLNTQARPKAVRARRAAKGRKRR